MDTGDRTISSRPSSFGARIRQAGRRLRPGSGRNLMRSAMPAALRLGGAVLQFVATLLIARALGAARSGDFFFWSAIFRSTGQISTFGLDRIALRQIPRMEGSPHAESGFIAPIRVTILLMASLASALVIAYAVFLNPDPARPAWWYLLPPLCIAGVALCLLHGEVMNGKGRPVLGVLYRHTLPTATFVATLLLVVHFATTDQLLACFALTFTAAGVGALLGPGFRGSGACFRIPTPDEFKGHLRQGGPVFLSTAFTAFTFMVPLALLQRGHPSEEVAYFTTAYRISVLFEVLSMAVHSLAMPALSRAGLSADHCQLRTIYRNSILKGLVLLGPVMLIGMIFAVPLTSIFGEGFRSAAPVLQALLGFGLLALACGPATSLVLMLGRTRSMASYAFWRLTCTVLISLFLIPPLGPIGMAIALGVGLLLEKALCLLHLRSPAPGGS